MAAWNEANEKLNKLLQQKDIDYQSLSKWISSLRDVLTKADEWETFLSGVLRKINDRATEKARDDLVKNLLLQIEDPYSEPKIIDAEFTIVEPDNPQEPKSLSSKNTIPD